MKNTGTRSDISGLVVVIILMLVGGGIIYYCYKDFDFTWASFIKIFYDSGLIIIISLFFIGVGIYGIIYFLKEAIAIKKEVTAILQEINNASEYMDVTSKDGYILKFKDKKGKDYYYQTDNADNYITKETYKLIAKGTKVLQIQSVSNESIYDEKENKIAFYFLTLYLPRGIKFEHMLLIPIIYIIWIPALISFIVTKGWDKLYVLSLLIPTSYFLIYDFYHKYINKN